MLTNLDPLLLGPTASIVDALRTLDDGAQGIALVVDPNRRLLGTVTDGDCRRAILRGAQVEEPVVGIMTREPAVATPQTTEAEVHDLLTRRRLRHLPVLDADRVLVGLHTLWDPAGASASKPAPIAPSAVIMAGGLGTRLRPLTSATPKPLLQVGGKPILERIVQHLASAGIEEVVITTNYLAEQIEGYFGDGADWDVAIDYVRERERLGTAGALRHLKGRMKAPFLVMNADLLTDFAVAEMFNFHGDHQAALTMAVRQYAFQVPFGVAEISDVAITALSEKPNYEFFVNAGIYVVSPEALEAIPDEGYFDITQLIDVLIGRGDNVVGFPIHETWVDIGRPEDLDAANIQFGVGGESES